MGAVKLSEMKKVNKQLAVWCIIGIGLFTSIGWPNIFSLALDDMGVYKSQVASLLVMAILGGALLPPLQGHIADVCRAANFICRAVAGLRSCRVLRPECPQNWARAAGCRLIFSNLI